MQLSEEKTKYIIRFKNRLSNRAFLIDALTQVGNRPIILVDSSDIHKTQTYKLEIGKYINEKDPSEFDELMSKTNRSVIGTTEGLSSIKYDPPPSELPDVYTDDKLMQWRATTGIEIVHPQETPYELIRNYNNWLLMDEAKRKESDKMCVKFFYYTNKEHFKVLFQAFIDDNKLLEGDIVDLIIADSKLSCRVYLDKIEGDGLPHTLHFRYLDNSIGRPFGETDTFTIKKGDIENLTEPHIQTTVGRFLLNQMLLVEPFGSEIPYHNAKWNTGDIEKVIANRVLKDEFSIKQLKKYEDRLFFIGHFSELCVPTLSRKALGTDDKVTEVKKQLLEKYKDKLTDPLIISEIENTLIAMDKKYLEEDSAMRFYAPLGAKAFDIARKKMYLTVGGIATFSKTSGEFVFLPNSLSEGWEKKHIPAIANEIRKGSYSRGFETQQGGVQTKLITRAFQDLNIYMPDCNTQSGLKINFDAYPVQNFIGRWVLYKGDWVVITDENLNQFKGEYIMRSPMYCKAPKGLCYKCVGELFRKLTVKQLAVIEIDISSTFLLLSMKNMHGTKLELFEVEDLDSFIV